MSDLFTPLRADRPEGLSPLPAAEVRRRGDRRRTRRHLAQVVASAAVVTAVLTGTGLVVGDSAERQVATPPESSSPAAPAVQRIPDAFPIRAGLVPVEGTEGPTREHQMLVDLVACPPDEALPAAVDRTVDTLGVRESGPERQELRVLNLYATRAAAREAADSLVEAFEACPRSSNDQGETTVLTSVRADADPVGEGSWTVTRGGAEPDGTPLIGQQVVVVVRVANALLLSYVQGEGPGLTNPDVMARDAATQRTALTPVVRAACELTGGSCRDGDVPTPLTPQGLGDLVPGADAAAVVAAGATLGPADEGPCRVVTYAGRPAGEVDALLSERLGLAVLFAPPGTTTDKGVGVGTSRVDARAAYPDGERTQLGLTVPLDYRAEYLLALDGDTVQEVSLRRTDQDCVG